MRGKIITMGDINARRKEEILKRRRINSPKTKELVRLDELEFKIERGKFISYEEMRELKILSKRYKNIKLTDNTILEIKFSNRRSKNEM